MRKVLIVIAIAIGLLSGCSWVETSMRPTASPTVDENLTFENTSFPCPTDQIREEEEGYPYPFRQDTGETKSVSELEEFCSRMKQRFSQSGMNVKEAAEIFAILKADNNGKVPWLHNECYGMPMCDYEPYVFEKQVMIKKIDNETYELFYNFIGCGINYHHQKIFIVQSMITGYETFERWSESYPC